MMGISRTGAFLVPMLVACGGLQTGANPTPDAGSVVPLLFDPTSLYREMGLLAAAEPVPFAASVHFLAGPAPDTAFAVVGISLSGQALSFRKAGGHFEARYRVEIDFERDGRSVQHVAANEVVRVASFGETLRADESVVFQHITRVPSGPLAVSLTVRDVYGDRAARDHREMSVPREWVLAAPLPVYRARARAAVDSLPLVLVNPRATAPFGRDTLMFYLEAYEALEALTVTAVADANEVVWRDTVALDPGAIRTATVRLVPDEVPVGRITLRAVARSDTARTAALVSFSDQWVITNFDDILSLLRYFGHDDARERMRTADPVTRVHLWGAFWRETDPNPVTPQNEALEEYFRRVQVATLRYQEAGDPGWLTDRGEAYITLGEPDEVFDQRASFETTRRVIRWVYVRDRLVIDFVDETGFGRFRMTPASRADFARVAADRREHARS